MLSATEAIRKLKEGHQRFLDNTLVHPHSNLGWLQQIASAQHPIAMVLSCSDSRVPVELMFDSGFGDLFVIRNAGNACTPGTLGSIEYGLEALAIPLLVVLGHEGCGAVTAACRPRQHLSPSLYSLVEHIRDGLDGTGVDGGPPELPEAFRLHPLRTAAELIKASPLIRDQVESGHLIIAPACYSLEKATIHWLADAPA
jgi:carbonic anhydrase